MIDPQNITNYSRTLNELEEFIIFCIMVAGKNATTISKATERLLKENEYSSRFLSPLGIINEMINNGKLRHYLEKSRTGKYRLLEKSLSELVRSDINLKKCSPEELEKISGIGPKTSRFFIVHSRPNQKYAVIDTHVTKWLKDIGHEIPKEYSDIEKIFLAEAEARDADIADMDLLIWRAYSNKTTLNTIINPYTRMSKEPLNESHRNS